MGLGLVSNRGEGGRDLLTCLRYELLVNFSDEWAVQRQRERERGKTIATN